MLKYLEKTGRNEEDALENALNELGLERDDVSVEVLERAKSGFLGLGSCPAKVRVTYEVPDEEVPAPQQAPAATQAPAVETPAAEAPAKQPASAEQAAPASSGEDHKAQQIATFLTGLLEHMSVPATPVITKAEEGIYQVVLEGENLGALIGRRGETLDAIQQLTNYAVNRGASKRVRIHVDAEHYRAKREDSLVRLATRVADKVLKYRRNVTLEPMNAYERHVIHTALQEYPGVTTYSTGTEPNRRTVVAFDKK